MSLKYHIYTTVIASGGRNLIENERLVQRIISGAAHGDDQRRKGSQILCSGGRSESSVLINYTGEMDTGVCSLL